MGTLLLPGYVPAITDYLDEIEKLGGVEFQFLTHFHDAVPELHEGLHKRFGCRLCHHKEAGPKVRQKSKCPSEPLVIRPDTRSTDGSTGARPSYSQGTP